MEAGWEYDCSPLYALELMDPGSRGVTGSGEFGKRDGLSASSPFSGAAHVQGAHDGSARLRSA